MPTFTCFTRHSLERILQRTKLSPKQIAAYLNNNVYIIIGNEPASNREHRIFYSEADESFYIAIQDRLTGSVVTILTKEYYENIFRKISQVDLSAAVKRAKISIGWLKKHGIPSPKESYPNTFFISIFYKNKDGKIKCNSLKIKANPFLNEIDIMLKTMDLNKKIISHISEIDIKPTDVLYVTIKLGKLGRPVDFELKI